MPLLCLELSIGQRFQRNAYDAFAGINSRARGIGLAGAACGIILSTFYMVLVGWAIVYLVSAFQTTEDGELLWAEDAGAYFHSVLELTTGPEDAGGVAWRPLAGTMVAWIVVALSICRGPRSMSCALCCAATPRAKHPRALPTLSSPLPGPAVPDVVYVTMPLPIITLALLLSVALPLPGAEDGLRFYLRGTGGSLASISPWSSAAGQVFFSLSLAGPMIPYASYRPGRKFMLRETLIIAMANTLVSLLSGVVVFATLGHMAHVLGTTVDQILDETSGSVSLAFVVFPVAISQLEGARGFFAVTFFLTLVSLGLDSAFGLAETTASIIKDYLPARKYREYVGPGICAVSAIFSVFFCLGSGSYYTDIVDHYLDFSFIACGLAEAFCVGWAWGEAPCDLKGLAVRFQDLLSTSSTTFSQAFMFCVKFVVTGAEGRCAPWGARTGPAHAPPFAGGLALLLIFSYIDDILSGPYGGYRREWLWLGLSLHLAVLLLLLVPAVLDFRDAPVKGFTSDNRSTIQTHPPAVS